jgi:hypothetical protein
LGHFDIPLKQVFFPFFPPHFPDNAPIPKLAVNGGIGTGNPIVKAFTAVTCLMFLARHNGLAVGMILTLHGSPLYTESNG